MIITTTSQLIDVCNQFSKYPFITVDTEFIRETTYFAQLCLIQIATVDAAYCIDPLSKDLCLEPLFDLLKNKNVLKVFHSARQDVEIFYNLMNEVVYPIFDTQIGAMVCGFPENAGYQHLVQAFLSIMIEKGMRVTNWAKRPLSEKQIEYALHDVSYLCDVYKGLMEKITQSNRLQWIEEETNFLYNEKLYNPDDETILSKARCTLSGTRAQQVYRHLYLWREHIAQKLNRPRRNIVKDEVLIDIARLQPKSLDELYQLRGISSKFIKSEKVDGLIEAVQKGIDIAAEIDENLDDTTQKQTLCPRHRALMELLRYVLVIVAANERVTPRLIADSDSLVNFIEGVGDVVFLSGWRYDIFGALAEKIKSGTVSIKYNPEHHKIEIA